MYFQVQHKNNLTHYQDIQDAS